MLRPNLINKLIKLVLKKFEWLIILFMLINLSQIDFTFINFIKSDGKGYYAYLPAVFIYHDLEYNFIDSYESRYYSTGYVDFRREIDGEYANMTFVGLAVLWVPFFLLAHMASMLAGFPADGYSLLYQLSVVIAANFYLFLGLLYLRKFLRLYAVKEWTISLVQLFAVFATPVYMYALHEAAFTHAYTFSLIIIFFYFAKKYFLDLNAKHLYLAFLVLSVIVIIRPTNMMAFAGVVFLAGSAKVLMNTIKVTFQKFHRVIVTSAIILGVLSIQFLIWYVQTGKFFVYTYTDEGLEFNFLNPQIINILFSYKKGFFLYTPIALLSLIGFIPLFRKNKFTAWSLVGFIALFVYVLSTWSHWWFGRSFGNRGLLDYMGVFMILLAFALSMKSRVLKSAIILLSFVFVWINQIQAYQYRHYILYWDMDKESYWKVFLKTGKEYENMLWREHRKIKPDVQIDELTNIFEGEPRKLARVDFEDSLEIHPIKRKYLTSRRAYEGRHSFLFDGKSRYGPTYYGYLDSLTIGSDLNITTEFYFWSEREITTEPFSVVYSIENQGETVSYISMKSEKVEAGTGKWQKFVFSRKITEKLPNKNNLLKVYVWYRGKDKLYIDNWAVDLYPDENQ